MRVCKATTIVLVLLSVCVLTDSISIGNEDYETVCGNIWQPKYTETHKAILNGDLPQRYFVSVPVKAGLADVILGYISGFLWAMLTNRAFVILHVDSMDNCEHEDKPEPCRCNQRSIEQAYASPNIDWKAPKMDRSQYRCMMPPYHKSFPCDENHMIRFREEDKNESKISHLLQVNGGYREEFTMVDMTRFPQNEYDANVIMFASNRGITHNIFDNPFHAKTLLEWGLRRETAFPCIFNYLFRINDNVCSGDCKTIENKLLESGNSGVVRIGIQVRDMNSGTAPEHFFCAESLMAYYESQGKQVILLLVTASRSLQVAMKDQYGDKLLLPDGKPSDVVSVHDRPDDRSDEITQEECDKKTQSDEQAMRDSARDAYLLSLTDMQIISRSSGFGVLGGMSRPRSDPAMFRMALIGGPDQNLRTCNETLNGDPLAVFANSWSGL